MSRIDAFRYRVTFAKTIEMRYTSHLDLQRTWDRLLRRAEVPLLFTQGYHPRPRFNLAAALPLGFIGDAEILELYLVEHLAPDALIALLAAAAPPGMRFDGAVEVDVRAKAVQTEIAAAEYEVALSTETDAGVLPGRIEALLAAESVERERRGKTYDLRPLVEELTLDDGTEAATSAPILRMRLRHRDGATGRPDEVLLALGMDPLTVLVRRTRLVLESDAS
jgi:radical SAM-linked protein